LIVGLQHFINIYFKSKDLAQLMLRLDSPETRGMLFWIFNQDVVAILVCHDIANGEFVAQIPYFPPVQSVRDYPEERCRQLVNSIFFADQSAGTGHQVDIVDVGCWSMDAVFASKYTNESGRVFLAGDSAHAYPPSGGFGMNTGVGDAFCLAHHIARAYRHSAVTNDQARQAMAQEYELERKWVGMKTRNYALHNFQLGIGIAN